MIENLYGEARGTAADGSATTVGRARRRGRGRSRRTRAVDAFSHLPGRVRRTTAGRVLDDGVGPCTHQQPSDGSTGLARPRPARGGAHGRIFHGTTRLRAYRLRRLPLMWSTVTTKVTSLMLSMLAAAPALCSGSFSRPIQPCRGPSWNCRQWRPSLRRPSKTRTVRPVRLERSGCDQDPAPLCAGNRCPRPDTCRRPDE